MEKPRRFVDHPRFALADLGLVVICIAASTMFPQFTTGLVLIAVLPRLVRLIGHPTSIHFTVLDLCLVLFGLSAALGWWSAYNPQAAALKFWRIIFALLLYYAVTVQPKENWRWVSFFSFAISLGLALYFFLTFNAELQPAEYHILNQISLWWSARRPSLGWEALNPNFIAGVAAVTGVLGIAPLRQFYTARRKMLLVCSCLGFCIILAAIGLSSSRGAWLAILGAMGFAVMYLLYKNIIGRDSPIKAGIFPGLILIYIAAVIILIYGLTNLSGISVESQASPYAGGRLDLLRNTLQLLPDYAFTGAGLESFPGQYTHYILGIKDFYLSNSRNLFLDVALEQGILGFIVIVVIYATALTRIFRLVLKEHSPTTPEWVIWGWLVILAFLILIFHGILEDNFYTGQGTVLSLFLPGVASFVYLNSQPAATRPEVANKVFKVSRIIILTTGAIALLLLASFFNWAKILSSWYANSGTVVMAQAELAYFPERVDFGNIQPQILQAEKSFGQALLVNPENTTALYRLGLIAFERNNFTQASGYLEQAHARNPFHRGITKYLGYSCTWLGNYDEASVLLTDIPEARYELDIYSWWWGTQGEDEYARRSAQMVLILDKNQ